MCEGALGDAPAAGAAGVNGLNGGLQLIASHAFERRSRKQKPFSFCNHRLRPESGVLLVERYILAIVCIARSPTGIAVQHERK
jgi:hypothetical protein